MPSDFVQALPLCVSCNPRVCTHAVRATVVALRASVAVPCGARLWPGPPCLHPFGAVILQVWKPHTLAHIHRASGCCGHQSDAVGMLRLSPGFLCSAMRHRPARHVGGLCLISACGVLCALCLCPVGVKAGVRIGFSQMRTAYCMARIMYTRPLTDAPKSAAVTINETLRHYPMSATAHDAQIQSLAFFSPKVRAAHNTEHRLAKCARQVTVAHMMVSAATGRFDASAVASPMTPCVEC